MKSCLCLGFILLVMPGLPAALAAPEDAVVELEYARNRGLAEQLERRALELNCDFRRALGEPFARA